MTDDSLSIVRLGTGESVVNATLKNTLLSLNKIYESGLVGQMDLYEALMLAKNPQHKLFQGCGARLANLGLVSQKTYEMHDDVAAVIRAAVQEVDPGVRLVSPL